MIVYFDESYDNAHTYLLYGALFAPRASTLHKRLTAIRQETGFVGEIKYTSCKNARNLDVCQRVIDAFVKDAACFRCVVVDQHGFDYSYFGRSDEPAALKQARAYKKFAEMLLAPNVANLKNAVLLVDAMTRCRGDEFLERMHERFNLRGGGCTFRHLAEVSSSLEQYQCLQVCDLLLGCVLNNLKPTRNRYKNAIREYLCKQLGVPSFLLGAWKDVSLAEVRRPETKFNVWYWSARKKPG